MGERDYYPYCTIGEQSTRQIDRNFQKHQSDEGALNETCAPMSLSHSENPTVSNSPNINQEVCGRARNCTHILRVSLSTLITRSSLSVRSILISLTEVQICNKVIAQEDGPFSYLCIGSYSTLQWCYTRDEFGLVTFISR